LVTAEDNIRIKRVMDRDGKTYREVEAVMEKQMPEKDKIKLADHIIYNNTNLDDLKEQTEKSFLILNKNTARWNFSTSFFVFYLSTNKKISSF
jgi:dephospho-CoA kinase